MSKIREIALEVLPHFAKNVLSGQIFPYGVYAHAIGRDPSKQSMVIGHAMHAIGAACVMKQIPVVPLHYVGRADGAWRGIFEEDALEAATVRPHYETLYVAAKIYKYTERDFRRIEIILRDILPKHLPAESLSPHPLWHVVINGKTKDNSTFFFRALTAYQKMIDEQRHAKYLPRTSA